MPTLTNVDPPAHTAPAASRTSGSPPTRRGDGGLRPPLVRKFLEERLHDGHAELVSALTWELPTLVVFHVLGVPEEDVETVKQGSANRLLFMFGKPTEDEQVDIATGMASFWRYCEELAEDRRAVLVKTSPPTWCQARRQRRAPHTAGGLDDPVRAAPRRP